MLLDPLLTAGFTIQVHVASAVTAFFLGAFILWRRKGTRLHKLLGRLWVVLMLIVATSSLFISEIRLVGPFSPIHLLSLITFSGIGRALWAIRVERNVEKHRAGMRLVYLSALVLTGAFTFLPGRRMHAVLFGAEAGWTPALIVVGLALVAVGVLWVRLSGPLRSTERGATPH